MANLKKVLIKTSVNLLPPAPPIMRVGRQKRVQKSFSALPWNDYFEISTIVQVGDNKFHVYRIGNCSDNDGPTLILLHGGGYSALTWSLFARNICELIRCQVVAIDLRGHGDSVTLDDGDMSADTLTDDVVSVVQKLFLHHDGEDKEKILSTRPNDMVLIGHSMGGAIAVKAAFKINNLVGLCVIDVVEGTALEALSGMRGFLRGRPSKFRSLEEAIEWGLRSGQVRNIESCRVSMPGQLKCMNTGQTGGHLVGSMSAEKSSFKDNRILSDSIPEEGEVLQDSSTLEAPTSNFEPESSSGGFIWRVDLASTEPYWRGWFQGLSKNFLTAPVSAKLLLLANIDCLDKELMVGQMQGKFQMQVVSKTGHAVHEDAPDKVAQVIASFLIRHKFTTSKGESL